MKMRSYSNFIIILIIILTCLASGASSRVYEDSESPQPFIIKGIVTVQFEDDVSLNSIQKGFGKVSFGLPSMDILADKLEISDAKKLFPWRTEKPAINSGLYDLTRYYDLTFPEDVDVSYIISELLQNPNIRSADPVWALPILAAPDDPNWGSQWHMSPSGPDSYIYDAWDIETGSDSIKLAMIDTGVNYKHRDLEGNIWVNPGEDLDGDGVVYDVDDLNGIDDDGNGVVDDLIGYDFYSSLGAVAPGEDGGGWDTDPNDFNGHGTHCAGIAAAMNNNGLDVTGMAGGWFGGSRSFRGVQIMCIRVGATLEDGNGYVNSNSCGTAIDYAAFNGANVISCSWGSSNTPTMQAGMSNATANGVTVCHAAGNDNTSSPEGGNFLDVYTSMNVLSVASLGPNSDIKSSFSNYGTWIDVSAPGSSILSTYSNAYSPTTAVLSGTSMACPGVAGLALLIRSAMPSLSKEQIDSLIINTADNIDAVNNPLYTGRLGSGRINAHSALVDLANAKFTADLIEGEVPLTIQFTDLSPASPDLPSSWNWNFGDANSSTMQNPQHTYNSPGLYDVSLIVDVSNPLGLGEEYLNSYIWVRADTLFFDSVEVEAGETVEFPIYFTNSSQVKELQIVFGYANSLGLSKLDSFKVEGLRTEYFEVVKTTASDNNNKRYSIQMKPNEFIGSSYLQPGSGKILNLYFTASINSDGGVVLFDTLSFNLKTTSYSYLLGEYAPVFNAGKIYIAICAHGDTNCDGMLNIVDLTTLVNFFFKGGQADERGADVNGDFGVNITDLTYLVNFFFKGGPPPASK